MDQELSIAQLKKDANVVVRYWAAAMVLLAVGVTLAIVYLFIPSLTLWPSLIITNAGWFINMHRARLHHDVAIKDLLIRIVQGSVIVKYKDDEDYSPDTGPVKETSEPLN